MDDPREWARGKTVEEILNISGQAVGALYQIAMQPQASPQAAPAPGRDPFDGLGDDDLVDGKTLKALAAARSQPATDPNTSYQLAQLALGQVKGAHREAFSKYEPEIMAQLAQLPHPMWTVDNINRVVRMVKADHVDELAEARARELAASPGFSVRTTGAASGYPGASQGGTQSLESEKLPAEYRDRLKAAGVTEAVAREFCRANGLSFESWLKQASTSKSLIGEE